jgi:hypothetical protein
MQAARRGQPPWSHTCRRPAGLRDGQPTPPTPRASRSPVANDKQGRVTLCKYILRPPLANDRLKILDDGVVRLEFKKPWSDGDGRGEAAWGKGGAGRP